MGGDESLGKSGRCRGAFAILKRASAQDRGLCTPSTMNNFQDNNRADEDEREGISDDHRPAADEETIDKPEGDAARERGLRGERNRMRVAGAQDSDRLRQPAQRRQGRGGHSDRIG